MELPLLQTKLHTPTPRAGLAAGRQAGLVPRPRLIERLDEGLHGKLTLISAPAGFGKTTLVSDWLDYLKLPAAWLSLDEDDNDLARFITYLIAALQSIQPGAGADVLGLLQTSPLPHSHTLLTLLIDDLMAFPGKSILVLDDYHTIEEAAIDQALSFFIEHLPPPLHLVVITRADPNLSISRLRANGQLNELRSVDLRFTPAETAQFLEQMTGLTFTEAEVAAVDHRLEGWIAGLQMTALSLRQRGAADASQFIEDFCGSPRYIMDYLVDEVLQKQPAEVLTFLLHTSILDRLCAPLCEAVLRAARTPTGGESWGPPAEIPGALEAQHLLEYLEHANLFIDPLDEEHAWYRYHPLFANLLRQRLQQMHPDLVPRLHLSASQWYEQAGSISPAIRHAIEAQAFDRAAALVVQIAPAMIQRSELARLLAWLGSLPEDVVSSRPLLALYHCWGLMLSGQVQQAGARLEAIEARIAAGDPEATSEMQGHIAAMRAYLVRETGNLDSAVKLSQQALAHLPAESLQLRAMVTLNLAIAYYLKGQLEPASQLLAEIIAAGRVSQRAAQLMANTLSAIYLQTQILRAQGALQPALELCQDGLDLVSRRNWHSFPAAGFLYTAYGDLLRERNELNKAAEYLERGIQLGQAGAHPHILIIGYTGLSRLRRALGDAVGSHEAVRAALLVAQEHDVSRYWPLPAAASIQARLWIAEGSLAAADRWAQAAGLNQAGHPITFLYEAEYLTLARLLIAQGSLEAAGTLLLRLHQDAASTGRSGSLIEISVLQAVTCAAQKRSEEALAALEQALRLAGPEGFTRVFLDEGAPLIELLRQAASQGRHASYALRLLDAVGETPVSRQPQVEPLSARELEVLRRVAAGYSNQEIARDLVVAVSTVKKHINNIYGKLEVESRTQAAARARELGFL